MMNVIGNVVIFAVLAALAILFVETIEVWAFACICYLLLEGIRAIVMKFKKAWCLIKFKEYTDFYDKCRADRRQHRKSGIYGWFVKDCCVYVGQSKELYSRFVSHAEELAKVRQKEIPSNLKYILLKPFVELIEWRELEYTKDLDEAEAKWILHYKPIFNCRTPYGKQSFEGTEEDIKDFIENKITYEDLKRLVFIEK